MRIVAISDTHNQHRRLAIPDGDVLIHAGDATTNGTDAEMFDFRDWLAEQPHRHKIFVGGNHDHAIERDPQFLAGVAHHLLDAEITVAGLRVYGSPHRVVSERRFQTRGKPPHKWSAFMIDETWGRWAWRDIPDGLDILVTHMPPEGIRDEHRGKDIGSSSLLEAVRRARPRVHIFGHVHEEPGVSVALGTIFVNVAVCDRDYKPRPSVRVLDWPVVV